MKKYTKGEAVRILIDDAQADRGTPARYRRVMRACEALGLDHHETIAVLQRLDYCKADGTLYSWVTAS